MVDTDQMPHFAASELGLHFLHNTLKQVWGLKWVKQNVYQKFVSLSKNITLFEAVKLMKELLPLSLSISLFLFSSKTANSLFSISSWSFTLVSRNWKKHDNNITIANGNSLLYISQSYMY